MKTETRGLLVDVLFGVLILFAVSIIIPPIAVGMGMFMGWLTSLFPFIANPVREGLEALGVQGVPLWKVGAVLGFVSMFIGASGQASRSLRERQK